MLVTKTFLILSGLKTILFLLSVLDEASSQVSEEMECVLYTTCKQLDITVMSIGHRSTVRKYHEMELHLAGDASWSLRPIEEISLSDS